MLVNKIQISIFGLMNDNIEYKIIWSKRKTYSISINSLGEVVVKVPNRTAKNEVDEIIHRHRNWITDKLGKRKELNQKFNVEKLQNYEEIILLGSKTPIILDGSAEGAFLKDNKLIINNTFKPKLADFLNLWFKNYAKDYFNRRATELSEIFNLKFNKIKISNARKRWGSCSSKGNINLAWRLIMADPKAIDSVILHELAHTVYMDHSEKFYNLLDSIDLNRKESDIWLRENNYLLNLY